MRQASKHYLFIEEFYSTDDLLNIVNPYFAGMVN